MRKSLLGLIVAAELIGISGGFASAQTLAPRPDIPIGIMCYAEKIKSWRVAYLYSIEENGDALYITPSASGRLVVRINSAGVLQQPDQNPGGVDCFGETVDQLRSNGRLIEVPVSK